MGYGWSFTEAKPGDRARESKVEDFFKSDAVRNRANALVREGIQNSLDAAPAGTHVRVRIAIGEWSATEAVLRLPRYETGFRPHLDAEGVTKKIPHLPLSGDRFRYLVFEDFGTSGLQGNPTEWWPDEHDESGAFFKYFRAEGISGKGDGARGRHGVGRLVFMFASRARMMFGLTRREEPMGQPAQLLMGTAVLRNHRLDAIPFLPDGWFGQPSSEVDGLILPLDEISELDRFKQDFGLARREENGLSVVVPWLTEEVTFEGILQAVLAEYFHPVLSGALSVEVSMGDSTMLVDEYSIDAALVKCPREFAERYRPLIDLARSSRDAKNWITLELVEEGAPRWSKGVVSEEAAANIVEALEKGRVYLRVPVVVRPKVGDAQICAYHMAIERDPAIGESQTQFIREGIHVTDVRPKRTSGFRSLIVIEKGALGQFLGDAENPSHTQWQKDMVRARYTFAPGLIDFVVGSIPGLAAEISRQQARVDTALLLDLFALPAESGPSRKMDEKRQKEGSETDPPEIDVDRRPRSFRVSREGSGFKVRAGDPDAMVPTLLSVKAAYDVRKGNPFKKYALTDFEFGKGSVEIHNKSCEIVHRGNNSALVKINGPDFEFAVLGFDVSFRDLVVDVRVVTEAGKAADDRTGGTSSGRVG